jgi:hypothetical protein
MRSARLVVLGIAVAGVVGLVLVAALQRDSLAFTLGVPRATLVANVGPGREVCQRPIDVPAGGAFDRVALGVGTYGRSGSPLQVTVRSVGGSTLATGTLAGGYPDAARRPVEGVRLDREVTATPIAVCVANRGGRVVALYGAPDLAARGSTAVRGGRPLRKDVSLVFERAPRSVAAEVPRMLARAALFRFPAMGAWAYVVLALLLVVAGPLLIARAVTAAERD